LSKLRDRREYNRQWYLEHKETENAGSKSYYAKNHEKCRELSRNWRKEHPEKVKEFKHRHTMKYLEKSVARVTAWKRSEKQRFIDAYGGSCACCGEKEIRFLTCEHLIEGQGIAHRKAGIHGPSLYKQIRLEGYPKDKYTVLCMNCNFARNHGNTCPHEANRLRNQISIVEDECTRAIAG
jgi:hypothetical protein